MAGADVTLIIGNRNYSPWSLRPWLLLREFGVAFEERRLPLDTEAFEDEIGTYSPSRRVPAMRHGALTVWDSLAICEYANETWLGGRGWPEAADARAVARSVVAEMHSGFEALRAACPMDLRHRAPLAEIGGPVRRDLERVLAIWHDCRERFGGDGPFLFGAFGIADAFYAPVATRIVSYELPRRPLHQDYIDAIYALPGMREWCAAAALETEVLDDP